MQRKCSANIHVGQRISLFGRMAYDVRHTCIQLQVIGNSRHGDIRLIYTRVATLLSETASGVYTATLSQISRRPRV